jgi:hypothetical protein
MAATDQATNDNDSNHCNIFNKDGRIHSPLLPFFGRESNKCPMFFPADQKGGKNVWEYRPYFMAQDLDFHS